MSKIKALLEKIEAYSVDDRNDEVQKVIKDKSIPLEERWNVYTKAVDSGYLYSEGWESFIPATLDKGNYTLYDNAYVDRYQTYQYNVFIDDKSDNMDQVKEDIMQDGNSHWVHDW